MSDASGHDDREALKAIAARAAFDRVPEGIVIGVGTGTTVAHFVGALAQDRARVRAAVASSRDTERLLREAGIPVADLNEVGDYPLYVDGADGIDSALRLIKGGGGALTREKICAQAAERFVCIADDSKYSPEGLGSVPIPLEVIPMARELVRRAVARMGGTARLREDFVTDNENQILDCEGLEAGSLEALEISLETLPGVVTCGVFARRHADLALIASADGVRELVPDG